MLARPSNSVFYSYDERASCPRRRSSSTSHDFRIRVTRVPLRAFASAGAALMTRRPPLAPQTVALIQLWSKVSRGGGSSRTPVPPSPLVASSSGGSVVLFRSRYLRRQSAPEGVSSDRCASRHVPAAEPPSWPSRCNHRAIAPGSLQRPGTHAADCCRRRSAIPAACSCAPAEAVWSGCCQIGGYDRVG
jgi:hypothetical protein